MDQTQTCTYAILRHAPRPWLLSLENMHCLHLSFFVLVATVCFSFLTSMEVCFCTIPPCSHRSVHRFHGQRSVVFSSRRMKRFHPTSLLSTLSCRCTHLNVPLSLPSHVHAVPNHYDDGSSVQFFTSVPIHHVSELASITTDTWTFFVGVWT